MVKLLQKFKKRVGDNRVYKGLFWNSIGTFGGTFLSFLASIVIVRQIDIDSNGVYNLVNNAFSFFAIFCVFGMSLTTTKFIANFHDNEENQYYIVKLSTILVTFMTIVTSIVILVFRIPFSQALLGERNYFFYMYYIVVIIIFLSLTDNQSGILGGKKEFKAIGIGKLIQSLVFLLFLVIFTYQFDLSKVLLAKILSLAAYYLYNLIIIMRVFKSKKYNHFKGFLKTHLRSILKFTFPNFLSILSVGIAQGFASIWVLNLLSDYTQLGIFNAANQWRTLFLTIPMIIDKTLLPFLINSSDSKLEFINSIMSYIIVVVICLPIVMYPQIIGVVIGSKYMVREFYISLNLLIFCVLVVSFTNSIIRKLIVHNRIWQSVLSNFLWAVVLLSSINLLGSYGSIGISLSYALAFILNAVIFLPYYIKTKVVNKKYLFSKEILFIWLVVIALFMVSLLSEMYIMKLFVLIIGIILILISTYSLYLTTTKVEKGVFDMTVYKK